MSLVIRIFVFRRGKSWDLALFPIIFLFDNKLPIWPPISKQQKDQQTYYHRAKHNDEGVVGAPEGVKIGFEQTFSRKESYTNGYTIVHKMYHNRNP